MSAKRPLPLRLPAALALCLAAAASLPAANSDPWLKMTSANFELYTTAGERQGRELIRYFEQVRSFFAQAIGGSLPSARPVLIIVFKNEKEYQPYKPNEVADAYYQPGEEHDFIVMSSASSLHYPVAVHEYTHLMIRQAGMDIPAWLNEGLAELYSTMQSRGDKIMVGQVIPGRMQALAVDRWIPLTELLKVDHSSPVYNEKSRAGIFYAESWALVHMLSLDADYRPKMKAFVAALAQDDPAAAFQQVYDKSPKEVEGALRGYFSGNTVRVSLFDVQLPKNVDAPGIQSGAVLQARLALAELQASSRDRQEQANAAYTQLASEFPGNWEVEEGMAQFAWRRRKLEESAQHFARAVELGCQTQPALLLYGRVLNYQDQTKEAVNVLLKAAQLFPESNEVQLELGLTMVRNGNYGSAAAALQAVKKVPKAEDAFRLHYNLAYAQYRLADFAHAKENAAKARTYTRHPDELLSLDRLLAVLERPAPDSRAVEIAKEAAPPVNLDEDTLPRLKRRPGEQEPEEALQRPAGPAVEGALEIMECGTVARLHLRVAGAVKVFVIPDPSKVAIQGADGKPVELQCGAQKPPRPLRLEYQPLPALPGVTGAVLSLEFK
ncbi:MAG: hypothetical protein ABI759_18810 [Candidatus Solibacter sp.]